MRTNGNWRLQVVDTKPPTPWEGSTHLNLAYHISTHKPPEQFKWLFDAIYDPRDTFVIHMDSKCPDSFLQEIRDCTHGADNVIFQWRISTHYFDWTLCQVELEGLRAALEAQQDWSYFINLSGQDYPLKTRTEIIDELSADPTRNYVQCLTLRNLHPRINRWKTTRSILLGKKRCSTRIPLFDRRHRDVQWYGSFWHILS